MEENIIVESGGIKCDNVNCDWKDETVGLHDFEGWLNCPCPKCGENLLNETDYNNAMIISNSVKILNSLSQEELSLLGNTEIDMESLKNNPLFSQFKDLEMLKDEGKVNFSIDTHNEIKITEISKINEKEDSVKPFDSKVHDGKIIIYTTNWDEFGDKKITANIIEPIRLKEIVEGLNKCIETITNNENKKS